MAQVFMYPTAWISRPWRPSTSRTQRALYIIRNSRLDPDWARSSAGP